VLSTLLVLWLVVSVTFLLLHAAPGSPSDRFDDPRIPEQHRIELRQRYGFDQPVISQYGRYLVATSSLDLGYSHQFARPVLEVLRERLPRSLLLGGSALVVATVVGIALALIGGWRQMKNWTPVSPAGTVIAATVYAMPSFWLALMLVLIFSYRLGWFPSGGLGDPLGGDEPLLVRALDRLHHLVLPTVVLAAPLAIQVRSYLSASLRQTIREPYVVAARARGLSEPRLLLGHALRPALTPVVQLLGVAVPMLLAGTFVVEFVFAWPGLGTAMVAGVSGRDYSLVLAITLLTTILVLVGALLADWVQQLLDPRVRPSGAHQ
jgi:peptide/nickel transport system permease protein